MKKKRKTKKSVAKFELINPNAAGIDIGAECHYVAVPKGRDLDGDDVKSFGTFTSDLYALGRWLKECQIETVAMESTSVYWITLFEILDSEGISVNLVNPQFINNVPDRGDLRRHRGPVSALVQTHEPEGREDVAVRNLGGRGLGRGGTLKLPFWLLADTFRVGHGNQGCGPGRAGRSGQARRFRQNGLRPMQCPRPMHAPSPHAPAHGRISKTI